jgi:hypothetical protein
MGQCLLNTESEELLSEALTQQHSTHTNNLSIIMNNIQQEQISFQQQIGPKFKEETNEMLQVWHRNFGIQIRNTLQVLGKNGKDQLDQLHEK